MSAYLEWLQKQETKVRRPTKNFQASTVASRAKSAVETAYDIDLAEASDAYKSWLQRREARLATAEQAAVEKETPRRDSKKIIADAVSKYTLLAKVAADSKRQPLPKDSSSTITITTGSPAPAINAALLARVTTDSKKRPLSKAPLSIRIATSAGPVVEVATKATSTEPTPRNHESKLSGNILERLLAGHVTHRRKRGIGDVEAPNKPSSAPLKHRKVDEETKHEDNSSSSSSHNEEEEPDDENDAGRGMNEMKKKRTPLDKALAKIDKKYGALVTLQDYSSSTSSSVDTRYPSNERKGIKEVQYWNEVDRFASLY